MSNNDLKYSKVVWPDIFSLEIPISWVFHEEDGVISLYDEENGVGVLQISFVKKDGTIKYTSQDLVINLAENFLSQPNFHFRKIAFIKYSINGFPATEMTLIENETDFWLVWHIDGNSRVACITYNCQYTDKDMEQKICKSIINTFSWID